jgi:hypothetical protein
MAMNRLFAGRWTKLAVAGALAVGSAALAAPMPADAGPAVGAPIGPPTAVAPARGSMVYVRNGDIYLARIDGSHAHLIRRGTYYWPSQDDHGVIAAEGFDGLTAPDGSRGVSIYRFARTGKKLGAERTPVDASTLSCPVYAPNYVSLSPDGKHLAYSFFACDEFTTMYTGSKRLSFKGEGAGQQDYIAPQWLSNSTLLVSHLGVQVAGGDELGSYRLGSGGDHVRGWANADAWALGFEAAATRNGRKFAVLEDDAGNYIDGAPRHVKLLLGTAAGVGKKVTVKCRIAIPARTYKAWYGTSTVSMSFAPDGSRLVFDAPGGSWRAMTSHLGNCGSVHAHLWKRNVFDVSFSPARAMS